MQRLLQLAALALALVVLGVLACRAQPSTRASTPPPAPPAAAPIDAGRPDAPAPPTPDVYLPASKSGGMFLEHQQAPR